MPHLEVKSVIAALAVLVGTEFEGAQASGLAEAYYSLGLAYRKAGDEERANGAFEKARELQVGQRR